VDQSETPAKTIADALQRLKVADQSEIAETIADALQRLAVATEQDPSFVVEQFPTPNQQPTKLTTPQERLLANFNAAIHPSPTAFGGVFKGISIFIVVVVSIAVLTKSLPFVPDWWACPTAMMLQNRETWKHICDWVAMFSQIAIVLFIGGAAFTESFARGVAGMAARLQHEMIQADLKKSAEDREKMEKAYHTLLHIDEINGTYPKARAALEAYYTVFNDARRLQTRYMWFVARGTLVNFPGGLYGFLGFMFLGVQVLAISTKISLDYLPASCSVN
jgi:hypothetical protein